MNVFIVNVSPHQMSNCLKTSMLNSVIRIFRIRIASPLNRAFRFNEVLTL